MNYFFTKVYLATVLLLGGVAQAETTIDPTWESLSENYETPEWFQDGKIGVWTHWGIPSSINENRPHDGSHYGRWSPGAEGIIPEIPNEGVVNATNRLRDWHIENYGPLEEVGYHDLIEDFRAENWDPDALVKHFKDCGARFIMPVATHHDNFDMYDSSHPWNSLKMGPKQDTIMGWKNAAQKHDLKFGVSTHLYWMPRFFYGWRSIIDPKSPEAALYGMEFDPRGYASQDSWNEHWYQRCWELIEKYDPDMFNNDSPYPSLKTGNGLGLKLFTEFVKKDLAQNNGKQDCVLSFKDTKKPKSAFTYNLERGMFGEIQPDPWMWATDISGNWFYRKDCLTKMSIPVLLGNSIDAISKNGVVMLNVALKGDGTLPDDQNTYLTAFGEWAKTNSEGIYGTRPWKIFGEGPTEIISKRAGENLQPFTSEDIRFTTKGDNLYAFVLAVPTGDIRIKALKSGGILEKEISGVTLLGSEEELTWEQSAEGLTITKPESFPLETVNGIRIALK